VNGDNAGLVAVADASGAVTLRGRFTKETLFRASDENHETRTQPWNCSATACGTGAANPFLNFNLNPLAPPADISGTYTMTIVADTSCVDIPADLHERTYGASISAQPPDGRLATPGFDLTLTDDSMVGRYRGFTIGVAGTHLGFAMHGGHDPVFVERLGGSDHRGAGRLA
jgi:hypothetical protein